MQYGKTREEVYREACRYSWRAPLLSLRYAMYVALSAAGSVLCRSGWAVRYRASRIFERLANEFQWDDGGEDQ